MQHLDDGTLHALADGEIPSTELAPIQRHLEECADCRIQLEAARAMAVEADALVAEVEVPEEPIETVPRRWYGGATQRRRFRHARELAWAASIVLALGLGYVGGWRLMPAREPSPLSSLEAPAERGIAAGPAEEEGDEAAAAPAAPAATRIADDRVGLARTDSLHPQAAAPQPAAGERAAAADVAVRAAARAADAPLRAAPRTEPSQDAQVTGRAGEGGFRAQPPPAAKLLAAAERAQAAPVAVDATFTRVSLEEAIRLLGGRIRLVEGLVPMGVEAAGGVVRVLYPADGGPLLLEQRIEGDSVVVRLWGPPGIGPDSLAKLRQRVK
jgi:hypothetical protein